MSCHRSEPSTVHRSSALPSEGRRPSSPATGRDALRSATPGQGAPSSRHDAGPPIGPGRRCRPAGTAPHFRERGADAAGSDLEAATGSRASRCGPARSAPWYVDGHGSPRRRVAEKRDPSVPPPPGGHRRRAPTPQGAVRRRRRCRPSSRTTEVRSDPDRAIRAPIMSLSHLRIRDIERGSGASSIVSWDPRVLSMRSPYSDAPAASCVSSALFRRILSNVSETATTTR